MTGPVDKRGEKRGRALRARGEAGMIARMRASRLSAAPAMKSDGEVEADCTPEHGQIGRAPPVTAVNGPARTSAIRAATAGPRTLCGDRKKIRVLARDLFDAAARHRTELVHASFYGVRCVTVQTSVPTNPIHANCGRATPQGEAHKVPRFRDPPSGSPAVCFGI